MSDYYEAIGVDLDKVVHKYSEGWQNGDIYDEPIEYAIPALYTLMQQKRTVFIFTSRHNLFAVKSWLDNYIEKTNFKFETEIIPKDTEFWNKLNILGITHEKLPAVCYIDDRAIRFNGSWEETLRYFDYLHNFNNRDEKEDSNFPYEYVYEYIKEEISNTISTVDINIILDIISKTLGYKNKDTLATLIARYYINPSYNLLDFHKFINQETGNLKNEQMD